MNLYFQNFRSSTCDFPALIVFCLQVEISKNVFVPWDRGGSMTLSGIAKRMEPQQLSALKKSCGGLQTLLKNHRHIFSILDGEVSLQVRYC